jgi:hypothetical protein
VKASVSVGLPSGNIDLVKLEKMKYNKDKPY